MRRLALFVLLAPAIASAHPEWSPVRVNRYWKLVLGEQSHIVYTVLYGDTPALPERKAVDKNGDGHLDPDERHALGERIEQRVRAGLHVMLDGRELALTPTIDVGLAGDAVTNEPFSVDLTYALPQSEMPHTMVIDDRVEVSDEGDSEIAVEDAPPAQVFASFRGVTGEGVDKIFQFRGPRFSLLEDRRVTIRYQTKQPTLASRLRGLLVEHLVVVLAAVTLAIALAIGVRRYRSM